MVPLQGGVWSDVESCGRGLRPRSQFHVLGDFLALCPLTADVFVRLGKRLLDRHVRFCFTLDTSGEG